MKNRTASKRFYRYFTITELIVAMGIFTLISIFTIQTFSGIQNVWKESTGRNDTYETADVIMNLLVNDLRNAVDINAYDAGDKYESYKDSAKAKLSFYVNGSSTAPQIYYLTKKEGNYHISGFYLTSNKLYYVPDACSSTSGYPFVAYSTTPNISSGGYIVAENVIGFSMKRFDHGYTDIGTGDADKQKTFPEYVIITLVMVDEDKLELYNASGTSAETKKAMLRTFKRIVSLNKIRVP